jgi:diacylglycerol kinase family enzyme
LKGELLALGIGNGRQAGGGHVCPEALADDGLLDISILPAPQEVVGTLRELMNNGWGLDAMFVRPPALGRHQGRAGPVHQPDGEPLEATTCASKPCPGLRVHLPVNSPLVVQADDLLAHGE